MNTQILVVVPFVAVLCALLILSFQQRRRCFRLRSQIGQLKEQLQQAQTPAEHFAQELSCAERRTTEPDAPQSGVLPDRYRHISAMARQGVSATQIASILQIGEGEAAQVVRLARLQQGV